MKFIFAKLGITDDAVPTANPASLANRAFGIPAAYDYAKVQPTGSMAFAFEFLDANSAVVAGVSATATLWLCDSSVPERPFWYRSGGAQAVISGQVYSFPTGTMDRDGAIGFLQITGITGGSPVSVFVRGAPSVAGVTAQYLAAGRTMSDGDVAALLTTLNGFLKVSMGDEIGGEYRTGRAMMTAPRALSDTEGATTNYNSGSSLVGTAGLLVKGASAGRLYRAAGANTSTTVACFLVMVDKATAAVNGDQIVDFVAVPALTAAGVPNSGVLDYGAIGGKTFTNGCSLAFSSTPHVVTLILANVAAAVGNYA